MIPAPPTLAHLLGQWSLDPLTVVLLVLVAGLYLDGVHRYDARRRTAWPRWRLAGVLASRPLAVLTMPATGLAAFAAVALGVHLTGLFEAALRDETVHELEHAAFFLAGLLFFAPLIAADPLPHAPGPLGRFSWVMGGMVAMSIPGALLSFAHSVWYPYYLAPSRALGYSALSDQTVAGAVMWVGGGIVMFALALLFAMQAMIGEERRQQRREAYLGGEHETGRQAWRQARNVAAIRRRRPRRRARSGGALRAPRRTRRRMPRSPSCSRQWR
ncbi:MAG TPA: cytochrome c oxidase assembly protein [Solirubrobacteraceae bacterium]|jgi:cytochrome c oxidase assembly factor CtaG